MIQMIVIASVNVMRDFVGRKIRRAALSMVLIAPTPSRVHLVLEVRMKQPTGQLPRPKT